MNAANNEFIVIAQSRLLSAIADDPSVIDRERVTADYFFTDKFKALFSAMDELAHEGVSLTPSSIFERASKKDEKTAFTDAAAIFDFAGQDTVISDCLSDLRHAKVAVEARSMLGELGRDMGIPRFFDEQARQDIRKRLVDIETMVAQGWSANRSLTMKEWGDDYQAVFDARRDGKRYKFYEPILDRMVVDGPAPGGGGILCASTGMGKSVYALHITKCLLDNDVPTIMFSPEMSAVNTMDRLLSSRLEIPYRDIVDVPDLDTFYTIRDRILSERKSLEEHKRFRICDSPSIWLTDVKAEVRSFQATLPDPYCVVIIDLLTMVRDFASVTGGLGLPQQIEIAINNLNALSKEMGFHYIGVVQLNRTVESFRIMDIDDIDRLKPMRSSVKNSGALLERSRYALSLFRKKYYAEAYLEKEDADVLDDVIELGLMKASNAKVGKAYYMFDGEIFKVTPLIDEDGNLLEKMED